MKPQIPHILMLAISAEQNNTVQNNVLYKTGSDWVLKNRGGISKMN